MSDEVEIRLNDGRIFCYWPDSETWTIERELPGGGRELLHAESMDELLSRVKE